MLRAFRLVSSSARFSVEAVNLDRSSAKLDRPRVNLANSDSEPQLPSSSSTLDLQQQPLSLTERCADKLKKVAGDDEGLRVMVDSGGCNGFEYKFELIKLNTLDKDDRIFEKNGAKIVVDSLSLNFMRGSTVDYQQELIKSAFRVVSNPNAAKGCSCGSSFSLKTEK